MTVETELKLHIAPEHLNRLKRHPLLKQLSSARATTRNLYSVYYDTPDLWLRRHGMALRLRRAGKQWLQTMKGGGEVRAGLHQRNEWETPAQGEALDFAALEAVGAANLPPALHKKLQPLFVTDFTRTSRVVVVGGTAIELAMDSGEIRAGQAASPISELELELKSGETRQLFGLALALLDVVPLELEHTSKAEYGYILYSAAKMEVCKARNPVLEKSRGIPAALHGMIGSCLQHLQANVPGAVHKLDEEYLHQVRVALRRLRVALGMAEIFHPDAELTALHEQVAGLCAELGRSREWDVFVTQTLAPICAHLPEHDGLRDVLRASEKLREQHQEWVQDILQSQDYQRFLLRFGAWLHGDHRGAPVATDVTLPRFAAQVLRQRSKRVAKRGRHLAAPLPKGGKHDGPEDVSQLHALRIACKKLRYSAELFYSLYAEAGVRRYLSALAPLQDILGMLNDIAVARRLLDELTAGARHETVALIRGWIEHDYSERLAELREAWKKFSAQKAFW
ncbi:MAG: CHAD domain-containing protein [Nitrosomonadales bacterium]|nr:CHAD domain-containing protein [Nitrosomonadales bacterium]